MESFPGEDVGLCLRLSAIPSNPPHPVHFLAIDVTTTSPPQLDDAPAQPQLPVKAPDTEPAQPAHKPNPITKAHLDSLCLKLLQSQQVNNPGYFQALLDNKIMLLPFTVDPFGGLGTHAHAFLYGTNKDTPNNPQHHPLPIGVTHSDHPMLQPTTTNHSTCQTAYCQKPQNITNHHHPPTLGHP
jgi:hypothetical protein